MTKDIWEGKNIYRDPKTVGIWEAYFRSMARRIVEIYGCESAVQPSCGMAVLLRVLDQMGVHCTGIESSKTALEVAKMANPIIEFIEGPSEEAIFEGDKKWDCVILRGLSALNLEDLQTGRPFAEKAMAAANKLVVYSVLSNMSGRQVDGWWHKRPIDVAKFWKSLNPKAEVTMQRAGTQVEIICYVPTSPPTNIPTDIPTNTPTDKETST